MLLYDLHKPKNPDLPYTNYERFDLDKMTDDECKTEFRFYKNDIYNLADVLTLPDRIVGANVDMVEALCIFLKRFAYPCRYVDMIPRFGRPEPQLCMISNAVINELYQTWNRLLTDLNQDWLSPNHLEEFAAAVHNRGAALDNCWGFVDGTVRPICRPGQNQKCLYNGQWYNKLLASDIINYFKFLAGKMYVTCALLHSARVCCYGSTTSDYFDVSPPEIGDYFH